MAASQYSGVTNLHEKENNKSSSNRLLISQNNYMRPNIGNGNLKDNSYSNNKNNSIQSSSSSNLKNINVKRTSGSIDNKEGKGLSIYKNNNDEIK